DDGYAAPRHAQVEAGADGALVLRDLDSLNGVVHQGRRTDSLALTGDTVFRLGHTSLRVRTADYAVAPEKLDRTRHGWEGALPALCGLLMVALFALASRWVNDTQSFQLNRYLQALAFALGLALAWSGAWAFANRLFGRHARIGRHLFILGCGAAAISLYKAVSSVVAFAFSLDALARYGSHVAIAIAATVVFYHLCTVKPDGVRRFRTVCIALALLGSGLSLINNDQRTGRLGDDLYMSVILPPGLRVSPDHDLDEYMQRVGRLKAELDVERTRKVRDDGEDDE
ncbi:MAG: FHA domain-containing protein, partial [Gammaproteobacteria bacterium]